METHGLPEGWTQHSLSVNTFYYHKRNNVWQREPLMPSTDFAQPQPEPELPPSVVQFPVATAVEMQQGWHAAAPVAHQALNRELQMMPASATTGAYVAETYPPVVPTQQSPRMTQIKVIVPAPGVAPGQLLAFMAPGGANGQPQQVAVTLPEGAAPGSTVTVEYPSQSQALETPLLPQPLLMEQEADRRMSKWAWRLYFVGWGALCWFAPLGILLWAIAAGLYFCMSRGKREQRPLQRTPAVASVYTCLGMACMSIVALIVFLCAHPHAWHHMTHPHHWHPHTGDWHGPGHHFHDAGYNGDYKGHGPRHPHSAWHHKPGSTPHAWAVDKKPNHSGFLAQRDEPDPWMKKRVDMLVPAKEAAIAQKPSTLSQAI